MRDDNGMTVFHMLALTPGKSTFRMLIKESVPIFQRYCVSDCTAGTGSSMKLMTLATFVRLRML